MKINIIKDARARLPRKRICMLAGILGRGEKCSSDRVNIIFITDQKMRTLNKKFRGIDQTTDVLSFNIDGEQGKEAVRGEVYISVKTALSNSKSDGVQFDDEILQLCCHGLLHILGYDHANSREQLVMQAREKTYLNRVGK